MHINEDVYNSQPVVAKYYLFMPTFRNDNSHFRAKLDYKKNNYKQHNIIYRAFFHNLLKIILYYLYLFLVFDNQLCPEGGTIALPNTYRISPKEHVLSSRSNKFYVSRFKS